jgi:hypothetical protein
VAVAASPPIVKMPSNQLNRLLIMVCIGPGWMFEIAQGEIARATERGAFTFLESTGFPGSLRTKPSDSGELAVLGH